MKKRLITPIFIALKPNYYLLAFIVGFAFAISLVLFFYIKLLIIKFFLILMVCGLAFFHGQRDALLQTPRAWRNLQINAVGELRMTNQAGAEWLLKPAASSYISPNLTVLNWQKSRWWHKAKPPFIVLGEAENTRALRVWLKWANQAADVVAD